MWRLRWQPDEQRHRDATRSRLSGALVHCESARTTRVGFTTWVIISSAFELRVVVLDLQGRRCYGCIQTAKKALQNVPVSMNQWWTWTREAQPSSLTAPRPIHMRWDKPLRGLGFRQGFV